MSNLLLVIALGILAPARVNQSVQRPQASRVQTDQIATLKFNEFFEISGSELRPSRRLMSLNGRRVRITGYMAMMEEPLRGVFYLCPRRVYADESGGGTADLPVETVLVKVNSAKDRELGHIPNPIEVVGILEIVEPGREAAPGSRI